MFFYYNIWLVDSSGRKVKHIDTIKCLSESTAEQQAFNKFGSASKYSGWGRDNFKAERC
jgi:hypothetical protein